MGTQSHGSVDQMRTDVQIARPPKFLLSAVSRLKEVPGNITQRINIVL
jgi:hypothetical protein